jgi:hypothetical protein
MGNSKEETVGSATELGRHLGGVAVSMREDGGTGEIAQDWREAVEGRAEEVLAWINSRPVTSVLIAAGIGYLFGRMARR